MAQALNGPCTAGSRVPVEVEAQIDKTWAGQPTLAVAWLPKPPRTRAKGKKQPSPAPGLNRLGKPLKRLIRRLGSGQPDLW